jgi:hypothetical protein
MVYIFDKRIIFLFINHLYIHQTRVNLILKLADSLHFGQYHKARKNIKMMT